MRRTGELLVTLAVAALLMFGFGHLQARAGEVLVNGGLEQGVAPLNWSIATSVTGIPGSEITSVYEHNDGANQPTVTPGQLGILVKPQAGNLGDYAGMNKMTNFSLSQTANAIAGRAYTLSGWAFFGGDGTATNGYSGGVTNLDPTSPSGNIPSPTQTNFQVDFLKSDLSVLATSTLDLRTVQTNDSAWHQQTLVTPAAPALTAKVRVSVNATNMVDNFGYQDVMFDNFSLTDSVATTVPRILNGNLNTPGDPLGYTQVEGPSAQGGTADTIGFANPTIAPNSNHTPGGAQSLWIRPYVNTTQFEPDIPTVFGSLSQTVAGTPGANYAFSAWTAWQQGYAAGNGDPSVQNLLEIEFLDSSNNVIGSALTLNLYTAGMRNDANGGQLEPGDFQQFGLNGNAPAGTTHVRVSVVATGLYNSFNDPQSAFYDDFSLIETTAGVQGDYNGNGVVDAADYVLWRKGGPLQNDPTPGVQPADYTFWRSRFGATSGSGSGVGAAAAVPEPAAFCLAMIAVAGGFGLRRRWL